MKLVFVASLLPVSTKFSGVRAKTCQLRIRIMSQSGAKCLPADCFSEVALKNPTKAKKKICVFRVSSLKKIG